jgi:hypothetical protein
MDFIRSRNGIENQERLRKKATDRGFIDYRGSRLLQTIR